MSETTTAVATREEESVELSEAGKSEIAAMKQQGALAVAKQREINNVARQLAGMKWGDVRGDTLSPHTRYAISKLCILTRADPALHINILGGRVYLNAEYWAQIVADNPRSLGYDQRNISAAYTADLRKIAAEAEKDGDAEEAIRLKREAREADRLRSHYDIPDNAAAAYETTIRRYHEHAPLAAIITGQVDPMPFIGEVREANWAGGKKGDPVGDARPGETARTRSLRRAAVRSFATELAPMEEELRKLENAIEAEFTVVESSQREEASSLPRSGEVQAVLSSGEPTARSAEGARPLPTREVAVQPAPPNGFDAEDARKRFFATFRDAGISADRKEWAAKNALPDSTGEWTEDDYDRAQRILEAPTLSRVTEAALHLGVDDIDRFALDKLGRRPSTLRDWQQVLSHLNALADAGDGRIQ